MDNSALKIKKFTYDMIYIVLWVIEAILLVRFLFKLLGANPQNGIVAGIYSVSWTLMGPFANMFGISSIGGVILEPSVLIVMVFYAFMAYLLVSFMRMIGPNNNVTAS